MIRSVSRGGGIQLVDCGAGFGDRQFRGFLDAVLLVEPFVHIELQAVTNRFERPNLADRRFAAVGSALAVPVTPESGQRAARLVAAAEVILANMKAVMEPFVRRQRDRTVAVARVALDEEAFKAAWAEGEKMTLDEAVAYALEIAPAVS